VINIGWQQVVWRFGTPKSLVDELSTDNNATKIDFQNKGIAVIAYGKMGGNELSYGSDLDLVFVHNSSEGETTTGLANGEKSVSASQFYMKLAQRIMHIFNSRMSSGILYELDMRLRPSGNSGVLVGHINSFAQYQQEDAWTWEHQALVRARIVYGNSVIKNKFTEIRQQVLCHQRTLDKLSIEVSDMREKMRNHLDKSTNDKFDIKQGVGGLVDIEFLAQYLVLAHCHENKNLSQYCDNLSIFKQLASLKILTEMEQQLLSNCYQKLRGLGHKATLQNKALLIGQELVTDRDQVMLIWKKFLQ
jgi:glutamate-ammonia-ligase adenylyltransferase